MCLSSACERSSKFASGTIPIHEEKTIKAAPPRLVLRVRRMADMRYVLRTAWGTAQCSAGAELSPNPPADMAPRLPWRRGARWVWATPGLNRGKRFCRPLRGTQAVPFGFSKAHFIGVYARRRPGQCRELAPSPEELGANLGASFHTSQAP
jgi:hypothetical protein